MDTIRATLQPLIDQFIKTAEATHSRRIYLGDLVNKMLAVEGSTMNGIVTYLREAMPNAKVMLGYAITRSNLQALAELTETFTENGGLVSPDGVHHLTRADVEALQLTPAEGQRLTELVREGKLRVKTAESAARRIQRDKDGVNGERGAPARQRLLDILKQGDEKNAKYTSADQIRRRLEAIEKRQEKLAQEARELQAQLASISEQQEPAEPEQHPEPPVKVKGKPKPRVRKGPDQSQPSAS